MPDEYAHDAAGPRSPSSSAAIALYAPRNLNAPARWKYSALQQHARPDALVERARGEHRRAVRDPLQPVGRGPYVLEIHHGTQSASAIQQRRDLLGPGHAAPRIRHDGGEPDDVPGPGGRRDRRRQRPGRGVHDQHGFGQLPGLRADQSGVVLGRPLRFP